MNSPDILKAAEEYVRHGIPVIPTNGKVAAISWKEFQTRLPTMGELLAWFGVVCQIRFNIAIITGSLSRIIIKDFDDRAKAEAFFRQYRACIRTIVETPRPGWHFWFRHPGGDIRNTQGDKEDLRGDGGYANAPPSAGYKFVEGFGFVPPEQLCPFPEEPKKEVQQPRIVEDDRLQLISRAIAYVDKCDPAVAGAGGHNQTFRVCCKLVRMFGLSATEAWPILLQYNERCQPRWSERELRHKLTDATKGPKQ